MPSQQREVPKIRANSSPAVQVERRWWTVKGEDELAPHMLGVAREIKQRQSFRVTRDLHHARLYSNHEWMAHQLALYGHATPIDPPIGQISLNAIKACVDTAGSKIAKNKPRPQFLTEEGNYKQQQRGKKLTQYLEGLFDEEDAYEKGQKAFFYGSVYGTGPLKWYRDKTKIYTEAVLPSELLVDDLEGLYGAPRCMYHCKYMHREVAAEMFGDTDDKKKAIEAARNTEDVKATHPSASSMIWVVEGWHLPSGPNATDGCHAIVIDGKTLFREEWKKRYFPFAFFRWSPRLLGFYGGGIPEEIQGLQIELNRLLRDIQKAHSLVTVPRVLANENTSVKTVSNEIGSFVRWSGVNAPEFFTPQGMPDEVYRHIERLWDKCFQVTGLSQMSAAGQKPAGLDSGKALREFNDIESDRFVLAGQCYEKFFLDSGRIAIDLQRELAEETKSKVKVKGAKFIRSIDWKDADLEEDQYVMRAFPTAFLSKTPAGRLADVQELIESGLVEKEFALSLLDFPDLDSYVSLATAAVDDIRRQIGLMLDDGEAQIPDPIMNLPLAIRMVQSAYLRGKNEGVPQQNLDLLLTYMKLCKQILDNAAAAQPNPNAAPALPAPAAPVVAPPPAALPAPAQVPMQ